MSDFLDTIHLRRSIYGISDQSPLANTQIEKLLGDLIRTMPTAYNMQSTRMVLLLGENHARLWDIVLYTLEGITPAEQFARTRKKIAGFAAGHGSVLFFDDEAVTRRFAQENPLFKDNFPVWALQQNGMLQFAVWTLFAEQGLGASLQHYNPLIDDQVKKNWDLPESWKLWAQMPFGTPTQPAGEREYNPIETRFKIFE